MRNRFACVKNSAIPPQLWMFLCKNGKKLIFHSLNNNDSMA